MKTIVLVGCGKGKLVRPAKAKDLYTGQLFKKARAYAEKHGELWRILSAKYGLLDPEEVVEPYDETIAGKSVKDRRMWSVVVRNAINSSLLIWVNTNWDGIREWQCDPVKFVCLAGEPYLTFFDIGEKEIRKFCIIEKPLEGMGIGKRLQWLSQESGGARNDARNAESVPGVAPAAPLGESCGKENGGYHFSENPDYEAFHKD